MIALYRQWLEARGCQVVLGSPYNLHACDTGVGMFGEPLDLVIRHYKTDWWGEREVAWSDADPYLDPDPLDKPLRLLLEAEYNWRVTVVNPFGTVATQEKRCFIHDVGDNRAVFAAVALLDSALYSRDLSLDASEPGRHHRQPRLVGAQIRLWLRGR